jgi:hypothetical protein
VVRTGDSPLRYRVRHRVARGPGHYAVHAVTHPGLPPEPSPFEAGYTRASESVPQNVSWVTTPTGSTGFQSAGPHYGDPTPPLPPRRRANSAVPAYIAAAVVLVLGGFLAGRLTAPKVTLPAGAEAGPVSTPAAAPSVASLPTTPGVTPSIGLSVTDPAGDAVPHPTSDGRVYGPSDITNFSVRTDGTDLIITTTYTPSTPMTLVSTETSIRLNPDVVPNCKNSVLDSADWAIDYDVAAGGISVIKPAANCADRFQPTSITGAADISGSTLTLRIAQASLGIHSGQQIVVRTSASTRIDAGHTTFIQDWAPDNPNGATGTV